MIYKKYFYKFSQYSFYIRKKILLLFLIFLIIFPSVKTIQAQQKKLQDLTVSYFTGNPKIILPTFKEPLKNISNLKINTNVSLKTEFSKIEILNDNIILRANNNSNFYLDLNNDKIIFDEGNYFISNLVNLNITILKKDIVLYPSQYTIIVKKDFFALTANNGEIEIDNENIPLCNENNTIIFNNGTKSLKNIKFEESYYIYFVKDQIEKELNSFSTYSSFYLDKLLSNLDNNNKFIILIEKIKKSQNYLEDKYKEITNQLMDLNEVNENNREKLSLLINNYIEYTKYCSAIKDDIEYILNFYLIFYFQSKVIQNSYNLILKKSLNFEKRLNKDSLFNIYFLNNYNILQNKIKNINQNLNLFKISFDNGKENIYQLNSKIFYSLNYIEETQSFLIKIINDKILNSNININKNLTLLLINLYSESYSTNYSITNNINKILQIKSEINYYIDNLKYNFVPDVSLNEGIYYHVICSYYENLADITYKKLISANNYANLFIYLFKNEKVNDDTLLRYYNESFNLIKSVNLNKIELLKSIKDLNSTKNNLLYSLNQKLIFENKNLIYDYYKMIIELNKSFMEEIKINLKNIYENLNKFDENTYEKKEAAFMSNYYNQTLEYLINYSNFINEFFKLKFGIIPQNLDIIISEYINLNYQVPKIFNLEKYTLKKYFDNFYIKYTAGILAIEELIKSLENFQKELLILETKITENLMYEFSFYKSKEALTNNYLDFLSYYKNYIFKYNNSINNFRFLNSKIIENLKYLKSNLELFYIEYLNQNYINLNEKIDEIKTLISKNNNYLKMFYNEIFTLEGNIKQFEYFISNYDNTNNILINNIILKSKIINSDILKITDSTKSFMSLNEIIKSLNE
jgi:hypothetical protein